MIEIICKLFTIVRTNQYVPRCIANKLQHSILFSLMIMNTNALTLKTRLRHPVVSDTNYNVRKV